MGGAKFGLFGVLQYGTGENLRPEMLSTSAM